MSESIQFCTFYLDGLFWGIPVRRVQEVLRHLDMTRVPLAPAVVQGLINLRGQIVTAIDLRRCLGLKPRPPHQRPMNVVIRTKTGAASFLVDSIGDVIEVDSGAFERPPEILKGPGRELVDGVYKLEDRLLLTLDTDRAMAIATTKRERKD